MVGGLTVPKIAHAFLVAETTMGQRITRAKTKIKAARIPYRVPSAEDLQARVSGVLAVLFLVFNEGCLATGPDTDPVGHDLTAEAIHGAALHTLRNHDHPPCQLNRQLAHDTDEEQLVSVVVSVDRDINLSVSQVHRPAGHKLAEIFQPHLAPVVRRTAAATDRCGGGAGRACLPTIPGALP